MDVKLELPLTDDQIIRVLDEPFECFDFDEAITLRKWFALTVDSLLVKDESFSGKRPFGNSGWRCYLGKPFVICNFLEGDDDFYPIDRAASTALVRRAAALAFGAA
jgi:hypothetical protein